MDFFFYSAPHVTPVEVGEGSTVLLLAKALGHFVTLKFAHRVKSTAFPIAGEFATNQIVSPYGAHFWKGVQRARALLRFVGPLRPWIQGRQEALIRHHVH